MGLTIPLAMLAVRSSYKLEAPSSFSYLYLANVLGATAGTTVPLLLIEIFGFHHTLTIGAMLNVLLAAGAFAVTLRGPFATRGVAEGVAAERSEEVGVGAEPAIRDKGATQASRRLLALLFGSGFCSMALEVVWIRQFTPYLGTVVYAFAAILGFYLLMTFVGSAWYRRTRERPMNEMVWGFLGLAVMAPLFVGDPAWNVPALLRLALGIGPFTVLVGYLTPMMVDRWSGGNPGRAGTAYAVNVLGCIVGPLASGFVLLPHLSERWVTLLMALPWFAVGLWAQFTGKTVRTGAVLGRAALAVVAVAAAIFSKDYESQFPARQVRRDHTATVIAYGKGMEKRLMVNGIAITILTPITKMMAHMPLAFLDRQPRNGLIICFGMGTTYRAMLSWGIATTAVDLVPSVPKMFGYYHEDAAELMRSPLSKVITDDGRRYLERTSEIYDVITIDPPPPVSAAGSSLLYSREFYATIKKRLRARGILQQWLPSGDPVLQAAVTRALTDSFPYVRVFGSIEGWGYHFLASSRPIPELSASELAARMPEAARQDLLEWGPESTAEEQFAVVLSREEAPESLRADAPLAPALQDDRPVNEYFLLRKYLRPRRWRRLVWEERSGKNVRAGSEVEHISVVLPESAAKDINEQCSRKAPPEFEATWSPDETDIQAMESRFSNISRLRSDTGVQMRSPRRYFRQCLGIVVGDRRLIYINAFCQEPGRQKPSVWCDREGCVWSALYDPASGDFSDLQINGVA
jgi:spermidine synthase